MRFHRLGNLFWAACSLASSAVLFDASPAAADPAPAVTIAAPMKLPHGVHRKKSGQYVASVCDETPTHVHCLAQRLLPSNYQPGISPIHPPRPLTVTSTPQPDGLGPTQIAAAYNLASLPDGTGNIVAVVDSPDYFAASDLAGYRKGYNLPDLPTCPTTENGGLPVPGGTPCFAAIDEDGALYTPTQAEDDGSSGADFETALDMDMASAACPGCSIVLVQLTGTHMNQKGDNGSGDILAAVAAASKAGAASISISLGGPEGTDPIFEGTGGNDPTGYSTPGHLVFAASGDFGYDEETLCGAEDAGCGSETITTPSYPSSAPDVISVGGTFLYNANGAGTFTEQVWDDGYPNAQDVDTSGCSTEFAAPSWQETQTQLPTTSCKMRATADVSAAAAYATTMAPPTSIEQLLDSDIIVYTTSYPNSGVDGFAGGIEGTSAASPMVAAIFARLGLQAQLSEDGGTLGWPYFNQSAFNDVTTGTDDVDSLADAAFGGFPFGAQCTGANLLLCTAGVGWDGPTGVGTPNGAKLLALLPVDAGVDAGFDAGVDAGSEEPDATTVASDAGEGSHTSSSGGCSCEAAGTATNGFGATGLLVGLAALFSRTARRRRGSRA